MTNPKGLENPSGFFAMYETLHSWENLFLAFQKAARGKRGREEVAGFEFSLEENLIALSESLQTEAYTPGAYTNFYIHEPKRRLISAAPFRDRVVHHALCNLIEPIFERTFLFDSYANRVGKGTHRARARAQQFARRHRYVLPLDVMQFFPDIDHGVLRGRLHAKIEDQRVRRLIDLILASGETVHGHPPGLPEPKGLPIGNLTSQFWANVYLNPIDHFIKRTLRCPGYIRYVDDLLLFADDKRTLHTYRDRVAEQMEKVQLNLHPEAHPMPVGEGIPFLGFVIWPERIRLKRRKGIHYRRKLKRILHEGDNKARRVSVEGWCNHVRYGNTVGLQKALLKGLGVPFRVVRDANGHKRIRA